MRSVGDSMIANYERQWRRIMKRHAFVATLTVIALSSTGMAADGGYAVVVSKSTYGHPRWSLVVDTLVEKHSAEVIAVEEGVTDSLEELRKQFPKYTCFVATPEESGRDFVAAVHQLTRRFDEDPYTDTLWGILTGYDAECAMRIAKTTDPLTVSKVASATEIALDKCREGVWYCELEQHRMVRKQPGKPPQRERAPADTTKALVDALNVYQADLLVTSGHATERDWQIGFRYRNGSFRCENGTLYGLDTQGNQHPVQADNPKVYLPVGNCLMGHIDSRDAMALAFMNSAGVTQMIGYTVPTWFGYGGWGCLDYFLEQPGRYTFVEAFFANHHALVHQLENKRGNQRGLLFDRDVVAVYGDPGWVAKMAEGPKHFEQELKHHNGVYALSIRPQMGAKSFEPVNTNGSQRGRRPIIVYLPHRIGPAQILAGGDLRPTITDDFILVPLPDNCDPDREYQVVFRAAPVEQ
jgi:zinc protease